MTKAKLRCSKLPLFMLCAGSGIPVRNKIIEAEPEFNDPAKLGSAVHYPLARMVADEAAANADPVLGQTAEAYNVDADDLAQLYGYGKRCWPMLKEHFGEKPIAEQHFKADFGTFILSGHPDMLSDATMDVRAVGDWKSGRVEYDARWQLYGAAILTPATLGVVVWLRETWSGEPFEVVQIPPEKEIIKRLTAQVEAMNRGECTTGPHCNSMYCERQHECEAYRRYTRHALAPLLKAAHPTGILSLEKVREAYYAVKPIRQAVKVFDAYLNERIDSEGEIELDDTKLVRLTIHPKTFDAQVALAVMEEFGVADPEECLAVAVKAIEKAVKAAAEGAGEKKGAYYKAYLDRCEEVGALTYGERKMRREIRI